MHKSPITLLVFATVCGSLQAGEMSVRGDATLIDDTPTASSAAAWSMGGSPTFSGSSEMDHGWSVSLSFETMDNENTTADNKTTGQIRYSGSFGTISKGGAGDPRSEAYYADSYATGVIPTAYGETSSWTISASHSTYNTGLSDENKLEAQVAYSPGAMPGLSIVFSASAADQFLDSGAAQAVATGMSYGFDTGIPGVMIGVGATVGIVSTNHGGENDLVNQNRWDYTTAGVGIGYAVSDELYVGYSLAHNGSSIDSADDEVSMGISTSYTMGGVSVKACMSDTTYINGVRENDGSTSKITLSYAF